MTAAVLSTAVWAGQATAGNAPAKLPDPVAQANSAEVREVMFRGPVVQRVTSDAATIMGKPVNGLLEEAVKVTVTPEDGKPVTAEGKFEKGRDTFLVRVEGLPADTVCKYEVTVGEKTVGPFHFVTAPADKKTPFRFAVYGDTRSNPVGHRRVADLLLASRPRFALVTGDLVTDGRNRGSWDGEYFRPAQAMAAYVPLYPCYGNHESNSPNLTNLFDLPNNGHWYSFDYGSVRVITLDVYAPGAMAAKQWQWLDEELAKGWDGWLIFQFHEPLVGANPSRGPNVRLYQKVFPLFMKHNVAMLFVGHDHHYMRTKPIAMQEGQRGVVQIVAGGGGAPIYGAAPRPYVAFIKATLHHVVVDVTPEKLTCTTIGLDGKELDSFVVEKEGKQANLVIAPPGLKGEWKKQE